MPSHLFIEDKISLNVTQRAQVFCKGEKLLGGPVNSTYENGVLYLECKIFIFIKSNIRIPYLILLMYITYLEPRQLVTEIFLASRSLDS